MLRLVAIVAGLIFAARALGRRERRVTPLPAAVPPHRPNEEDAEQELRMQT